MHPIGAGRRLFASSRLAVFQLCCTIYESRSEHHA